MSTKASEEPVADAHGRDVRRRTADIGKAVLQTLGRPENLHLVQVRPLWDDHFRVNVFVGPDLASSTVAHSYFLHADGDGAILTATPAITRHYGVS